jgi:hypothetical protein
MPSTEKFFQAFDKAGFLKTAYWLPSAGGAEQAEQVRFRSPDQDALAGSTIVTDYSIEYPATVLIGLARGEVVNIDDQDYTLRESPRKKYDGTVLEAKLRKGT